MRRISTSTSSPTFTTSLGWPTARVGQLGDGDHALHAAQVHERAEVAHAGDLALDDLALGQVLPRLLRQPLLLLLQQRAARQHHVPVAHLGDAELELLADELIRLLHEADVDLAHRAEGAHVADGDLQAALVHGEDQAFDRHAGGARLGQHGHGRGALGQRPAQIDARGARLDDVRFNRVAHAEAQDALVVLELAQLDHRLALRRRATRTPCPRRAGRSSPSPSRPRAPCGLRRGGLRAWRRPRTSRRRIRLPGTSSATEGRCTSGAGLGIQGMRGVPGDNGTGRFGGRFRRSRRRGTTTPARLTTTMGPVAFGFLSGGRCSPPPPRPPSARFSPRSPPLRPRPPRSSRSPPRPAGIPCITSPNVALGFFGHSHRRRQSHSSVLRSP